MIDATPLLRLYAAARRHRLARLPSARTQEDQLLRLVRRAADTRFGRDHGFAEVRSVADFQRRVPIRRYEELWSGYWQPAFPALRGVSWPGPIPYVALTSGTSSGTTKYIPVSREMVRSNRRAALDLLVHHVGNRPKSRVLGGKNFMLGGSIDLAPVAPTVFGGDLSAIALREVPLWAKRFTFPPPELARETDWERKIATLAAASLRQDIRSIAGTASWLPMLVERLQALRPGPPDLARFYPNLELVIHGGVNVAPYRARFERWLAGGHAELREAYAASEGFIAVADRGTGDGLRLNIDGGLFFEFIPVADIDTPRPARHWIADVETGRDYALVLSSCAGVWAYLLGDTIRFVDLAPPRILVTGRISYFLSAFGEHLCQAEIEGAVTQAAAEMGAAVADYTVGAVFPDDKAQGGHLFIVEFADGGAMDGEGATRFAARLDRLLADTNDDYKAHRAGDYGIRPPAVLIVRSGTFAAWMRSRGRLGGQNKVPRVINDQALFAALRRFLADQRAVHAGESAATDFATEQ
jgi:hypothetical protein